MVRTKANIPTSNKTIPQTIPMTTMAGNAFDEDRVLPIVYTTVLLKAYHLKKRIAIPDVTSCPVSDVASWSVPKGKQIF